MDISKETIEKFQEYFKILLRFCNETKEPTGSYWETYDLYSVDIDTPNGKVEDILFKNKIIEDDEYIFNFKYKEVDSIFEYSCGSFYKDLKLRRFPESRKYGAKCYDLIRLANDIKYCENVTKSIIALNEAYSNYIECKEKLEMLAEEYNKISF